MTATVVTAYVSKRSAAIPAQSPTLSPTLSAMTAGLRGSSSGMPASTLPTRSAPTSAPLVKMPPPRRAKTEISEPPKARPTSGLTASASSPRAHAVAGHGEQPEPDDEQPGHRTALEGDAERRLEPAASRLGRADVGAHRDVHADEAGRGRRHGADQEADRGLPAEQRRVDGRAEHADEDEEHHRDAGDDRVLPGEVCLRTLLDRAGDLLHALVARGLLEQIDRQADAVCHGDEAAHDGEPRRVVRKELRQESFPP